MVEDFINALNNFKTNKMRTTLSLLGIIIGVTSVITITTLGNSLQKSMAKEFSRFNMNIMLMHVDWNAKTNQPAITLNYDFKQRALKEITDIKNIFFVTKMQATVIRDSINIGTKEIEMVEAERLETIDLTMDYGSFFSPNDYANGTNRIIIGKSIATKSFPEGNAIGKKLRLKVNHGQVSRLLSFEVCGVLKESNSWFSNPNQSLYIPRQSYNKIIGRKYPIFQAEVVAYNENDVAHIKKKLEQLGQKYAPKSYHPLHIYSAKSQFEQANTIMNMVQLVIVAIASISLLVGGIGIMNIMLVTVTERKKEIGIRKALGATHHAIKLQFLIESATLTLTGGIVGVIFGMLISKIIISFVIPKQAELQFFFDIRGTIIAFAVSVGIGIFFGLHPAAKAAKLDPVVALAD